MAKRRTPWLQFDADFTQSPLAQVLCQADPLNGWRFVDLVSLARLCNAEGRLISKVGSYTVPYQAGLLHRRIIGDTQEKYQAFLDLVLAMGVLVQEGEILVLPDWVEWWGRLPKTDAERQANKRERDAEKPSPEEVGHAGTGQPAALVTTTSRDTLGEKSRHCHADATPLRDAPESERHADVTHKVTDNVTSMSRNSALHNMTEHDITKHGSQNMTKQNKGSDSPGLCSLKKQMPVPVDLNEMEFLDLMPPVYESIGESFDPRARSKLEKKFRGRAWEIHCQDWSARYLAMRYGARHLLGEFQAIEAGKRDVPINSPQGFLLEMAERYSPTALNEIERMRREIAAGKEPRIPRFRKIEPIEC